MEEFVTCYAEIIDPRQANARHDLHEILPIAVCTMLCGGEDCSDTALFGEAKEAFLCGFLKLKHGIPSHDAFTRLFRLADPKALPACFTNFMQRFAETLSDVVAIDGKTLRRFSTGDPSSRPCTWCFAWAVGQRLLLGQLAARRSPTKSRPCPSCWKLSLKGCVVTVDALNCQRTMAAKVVERGSNYGLALKASQPSLHDDVRRFLNDSQRPHDAMHRTVVRPGQEPVVFFGCRLWSRRAAGRVRTRIRRPVLAVANLWFEFSWKEPSASDRYPLIGRGDSPEAWDATVGIRPLTPGVPEPKRTAVAMLGVCPPNYWKALSNKDMVSGGL